MALTTGPVLTTGAITWANQAIFDDDADVWKVSTRVAVGTGIAALMFSGLERIWPDGAEALAWMALLAVSLTRIGGQPAPVERLLDWWKG